MGLGSLMNNTPNVNDTALASMPNTSTPTMQIGEEVSAKSALSLKKGTSISLAKVISSPASLSNLTIGLGWDPAVSGVDLDAEVFGLSASNRAVDDSWFIFYGQLRSSDGSIVHNGDNRTGIGTGDDETVSVNLNAINPAVNKIVFTVTIDSAREKNQNFSLVNNAYIRIVDNTTSTEIIRYNLSENYGSNISLIVGELEKVNNEWKFNAIGQGLSDDLYGICKKYGVNVQ